MKLHEITDNVVSMDKFKSKKQSSDQSSEDDLVKQLSKDVDNAFQLQDQFEQYTRESIKKIDNNSPGHNPKFKFPSIMSEYEKGFNSARALAMDAILADIRNETDERSQFAIDKAKELKSELIEVFEHDLTQLNKLEQEIVNANVPQQQYPLRKISREQHELKELIKSIKEL